MDQSITTLVAEVDGMRKDGKLNWMNIRKLQLVHTGRYLMMAVLRVYDSTALTAQK